MPTFEDAVADAAEAGHGLRGLAHATRAIEDPPGLYDVLGSLSGAAASFEQSLHQLAAFHDAPGRTSARVAGDARSGRMASFEISWELHRAAVLLRHVTGALHRAHEMEAELSYQQVDLSAPRVGLQPGSRNGLSL